MTAASTVDRAPTVAAPQGHELRADIQALRAIAVTSVMLYHLWPNEIRGGYVGVDVFFAISGFLITSHLLSEVDNTGRLRPGRFWARRAKRLVPASTIVLLATTLTVLTWVPHYLRRQFLNEIVASTLQVENWLLARNAVDYLAASNVASPTQHFWSLGVEEQFYVALPLLMIAALGLSKLVGVDHRRVILVVFAAITAGSLGYSIWLTITTPGVAYFSTLTRAWEFGAGALLAYAGASRQLHRIVPWLGIAAIIMACFWFDANTSFPGFAAALPVLGAVAVMWSGRASAIDRLGGFAPVALLGRISYSVYLWHWPLIVLVPFITHHSLTGLDRVAIIVATVLLAWFSTAFIEDPIRFRPRLLGQRRPLVIGLCAATAIAVVVAVAATASHQESVHERGLAQAARQFAASMPRCAGAQAMDPALAPCDNPTLDGVLLPDPAQAAGDDDNVAACWGMESATQPKLCHLGPSTGVVKRVLAVGDSHNNTLIGDYRRIANNNNWRIDVAGHGGCYLTTAVQEQPHGSADQAGCNAWRSGVIAIANQGGYDAIIVTHADQFDPVVPGPGETGAQATVRGLVQAWGQLPDVPIVAIRDNPYMPVGNLTCVEAHRSSAATSCAVPRSQALGLPDGQAEAALQVPRAKVVDLSSFYCSATVCPPVIGHVLVYRDMTHITATYAATLSPYLEQRVVAALH